MKPSNLYNPITVAAVGTVLCVLAAALIITLLIVPQQNAISAASQLYDANYADSTPQAQAMAKMQLDQANVQVAQIQSQWDIKQKALMPPYDVSHRLVAWNQLSYELSQRLGPDVEHWIPQTGVYLVTPIKLGAPPSNPNAITAAPLVINLQGGGQNGGIVVSGDFRHILTHILKWNDFNRLVMIDGLSFTGFSPYMAGTYTAKVYLFPQNDTKLDPAIPQAGSGGASTQANAGGMGGGGGVAVPGGMGSGPSGPGGMK